jgi:hypothetical protein
MQKGKGLLRRELLRAGGAAVLGAGGLPLLEAADEGPAKIHRIGVISASIHGKPQVRNGHTWHFAQYFHPTINFDALKKHDPGQVEFFTKYVRNPKFNFDLLPFPDTRITHYYDADPKVAEPFTEVFPGVKVARSLEVLVSETDAVWMGDASGYGEDHFDLVAPALAKGLPTFCDKPIGGSVAGTRKILEFARQHKAPLMSSSLFRHEWGMEAALRMRDSGEFGALQYVIASIHGGWHLPSWFIYGQHPVWTVMTLCGPGVEAVNLSARGGHVSIAYKDRMPAEVWYGRSDDGVQYCHTGVYFAKKRYEFTPAIEGDFLFGHHYEMFRMAETFRRMVRTRQEPIPHQEILEVTAIIHAAAKSLEEKSRMVALAEVMG